MENNKKITALIAARMGSSRLPGKTLMDLHGKPMIYRLIERVKASKNINEIVIATTDLKEDGAIEEWCKNNSIGCYRGSASDVLGRLTKAAESFDCAIVVEILGDNPLVHSSQIDAALEKYYAGDYDYVATLTNEYPNAASSMKRFPIGVRVQVMPIETMQKCSELAVEARHREHATSFIAENPDIFKSGFLEAKNKFSDCEYPLFTFAVNNERNLRLVNNIYKKCYHRDSNFSLQEAIDVFNKEQSFVELMGN